VLVTSLHAVRRLPLPPPPAPACRLIQALIRKAAGTKCGDEQPLPAGEIKLPFFIFKSFWRWDGLTFIGAFGGGALMSQRWRRHKVMRETMPRWSWQRHSAAFPVVKEAWGATLTSFCWCSSAMPTRAIKHRQPPLYCCFWGLMEPIYPTKDWSLRLRPVGVGSLLSLPPKDGK